MWRVLLSDTLFTVLYRLQKLINSMLEDVLIICLVIGITLVVFTICAKVWIGIFNAIGDEYEKE